MKINNINNETNFCGISSVYTKKVNIGYKTDVTYLFAKLNNREKKDLSNYKNLLKQYKNLNIEIDGTDKYADNYKIFDTVSNNTLVFSYTEKPTRSGNGVAPDFCIQEKPFELESVLPMVGDSVNRILKKWDLAYKKNEFFSSFSDFTKDIFGRILSDEKLLENNNPELAKNSSLSGYKTKTNKYTKKKMIENVQKVQNKFLFYTQDWLPKEYTEFWEELKKKKFRRIRQ